MVSSNPTNSTLCSVSTNNRIETIDILRGFALLGIFVMNITGIAYPFAAYFNPKVYGGSTGINYGAWVFAHLFFDLKMMGIFSMLFGAGIVLMSERVKSVDRPFSSIHFRRMFWLLVIGFIHAYLLWYGDILVTYALSGLILFLFRHRSSKALIIIGISILVFGALLSTGGGLAQNQLREVVNEIETEVAAGEELTPQRQSLIKQWNDLRKSFQPNTKEINMNINTMRGDWRDVVTTNIHEAIGMHTQAVPFSLLWRALAMMFLGMGLMRSGVFTAQRTDSFYRKLIFLGFGLGLPLVSFGIWQWSKHDYDFISSFIIDSQYNHFGSVLLSLAYVGIVMLLYKKRKLIKLRSRLAAVGRMSLTNYLMQTLISAVLFYGYALALFGQISRFHLWWFILGVWALQLLISPWWLKRFQFGPVEWLWRSVTYWQFQNMTLIRMKKGCTRQKDRNSK